MMFVSVGGQKPFPRLCHAAAALAKSLHIDCVMQTAEPGKAYGDAHTIDYISADKFQRLLQKSSVFISHAGMGNILAARALRRSVILLPRRLALGEHRNDHQMGTASALVGYPGIYVAWTEDNLAELGRKVSSLTGRDDYAAHGEYLNNRVLREELAVELEHLVNKNV